MLQRVLTVLCVLSGRGNWPLSVMQWPVCPSVCLVANEENLASLYYMRALARGMGRGEKLDNEKEANSRVREYSYNTPFSPVFLHPHPCTLWLVAAAFEIRILFSVARTHSGSNHTPLQSWLLFV